jgi:hypothetical protein
MKTMVVGMRNRGLILSMLACACILLLLLPSLVLADSGYVPLGVADVYEPGQKAIIAWDGEKEILILATDVRADSDTKALEIFPLPSQPEKIEQGDFDSFVRVAELIREHFGHRHPWWDCAAEEEAAGDGVEIVFHEKIGRHDVWVVKANDAGEFTEWAEDFLARNEIEHELSSPKLESLVGDYIGEGIDFFVFDLLEVTPDPKSVEPIVYQFKTDYLYYPLKISSITPGYTEIKLFLLTPKPLELEGLPESQIPGKQGDWAQAGIRIALAGEEPIQFELDEGELESIDQRLSELFGGDAWPTADGGGLESIDQRLGGLFGGHAWLTALQSYWGRGDAIPLESLDEDLKITEASFTEPPESSAPIWGWTVLGVVVLALGGLLYFRYRRGAQLRRMEKEYRKRAWERMQQR